MTDDDVLALCRIDGLTEDQLAGIDTLGAMTDDEVAAFVERFNEAWEANRRAVSETDEAITTAIADLADVEIRSGAAARARDPLRPMFNDDELAACRQATAACEAAVEAHQAAKTRFKAGVTREQLEA